MTVAELYDFLRAQYADRKGFAWYDRGDPAFVSDLQAQQWRIVSAPGDVAVCSVAGFWSLDTASRRGGWPCACRDVAQGLRGKG